MAAKKKPKPTKKATPKAAPAAKRSKSATPSGKKASVKKKASSSAVKPAPARKKAPSGVKSSAASSVKKSAAKKPAAKKTSAVKAAPKKAASPKAAAKSSAKPAPKAAKRRISTISDKPVIRTGPSIAPRPAAHLFPVKTAKLTRKKPAKKLSQKELDVFKDLLLKFRDRIIDEISFLANDNLNRNAKESSGDLSSYSFHMADQGTDNYDREFAASLLNNEHDVLYEIEEALRRIEQGTYGICEISEQPIERERLKVLPFARYCVAVQSEIERNKPKYRPFRRSSIQGSDSGIS